MKTNRPSVSSFQKNGKQFFSSESSSSTSSKIAKIASASRKSSKTKTFIASSKDNLQTVSTDRPIYTFFFRFWWTILVLLFCYGFYLHGMRKKKELYSELKEKITLLEGRLAMAKNMKEDLLLQIDSQTDPAWIEILLKKHLGMVPFGQTKVYFDAE